MFAIALVFGATLTICLAVFLRKMEPINWDETWQEKQDKKLFAPAEKTLKVKPLPPPAPPIDPTKTVYPWTPKSTLVASPSGKRRRAARPVYTAVDHNIAIQMAEVYKLAEKVSRDRDYNREKLANEVSALTCTADCEGVYHDGEDYKCLCGSVDRYMPYFSVLPGRRDAA